MAQRTVEIERLNSLYEEKDNTLCLFYGRRGMNQHEIISEFLQDKKNVYYEATECSNELQKSYFAESIINSCDVSLADNEYETLFKRIRSGDASKFVLAINNAEFILKKDPDFIKALISLKKRRLYPGPVMIILISSSVSFVETDLLVNYTDISKNIDGTIKLLEYNFLDVVRLFPNKSVQEAIEIYGVLGGVPEYLKLWDRNKDFKTNICRLLLDKKGDLYNEAHDFIASELREYSVYQTILATIASGNEKLNDIFKATGYSRPKISVYIKNLSEFDVVSKVNSFETGGYDNSKKGIYRIQNTFLGFYYKFIFPHLSMLNLYSAEEFYDKYIKEELDSYLGETFIKVCMEFLELSSGVKQLPITIAKMGTWIGKRGTIDIIAQDEVRYTIVGKCNSAEPIFTYKMFAELLANIEEAKVKTEHIYLFSAKGFENKLIELAGINANIHLVDMNEM